MTAGSRYSPYDGLPRVGPLEVTVDNLQTQIEHHLHGAVSAHPDDIAKLYWDLRIQRSQPEHVVTG